MGASPSRLDSFFREVEEVAAELIAASDRAREVGADDERDGGDGRRSGRPRRSPTSSHSGTDATHRNVEENEMELLDMVAGHGKVQNGGDVRATTAAE